MGKIGIIIRREFNERVKKKSFIISTILVPLLFIGGIALLVFMQKYTMSEAKLIKVLDRSGMIAQRLEDNASVRFEATDQSYDQFKAGETDAFGYLEIGDDIMERPSVRLSSFKASTVELESSISDQISKIVEEEKLKRYDIENLPQIMEEVKTDVTVQAFQIKESADDKESSSSLAMIAAMFSGLLMFMFVTIYGGMVMQGVIEEKSSKVLEVMVSSVRPYELMMGKILGVALVAITQLLIWAVLVVVVGSVLMQTVMGDMVQAAQAMQSGMPADPMLAAQMSNLDSETAAIINQVTDPGYMTMLLGCFLVFFVGGYLLYAAMFAAIGSAVDNVQDTQQLQTPVTVVLMISYFIMFNVMRDPYSAMAVWGSIIPLTSPIIMMARIAYEPPVWQVVLSAVLLYASFVGMVWFAGKIYRVGIFMYGKKPSFKELFKWVRYKY